MKKIILSCFILLLTMQVLAQKRSYRIYYDYIKKKIAGITYTQVDGGTELPVKGDIEAIVFNKGDKVTVIIQSINKYRYGISVNIAKQVFNNTPPTILSAFFSGPSGDLKALLAVGGPEKADFADANSKALMHALAKIAELDDKFHNRSVALQYKYLDFNNSNEFGTDALSGITPQKIFSEFNEAEDNVKRAATLFPVVIANMAAGDAKDALEERYEAFKKEDYPAKFKTYFSEQLNINAVEDFNFTSDNVAVSGDEMQISIQTSPIAADDKQKEAAINAATIRSYSWPVEHYGHFSFSTGFFTSALTSRNYRTVPGFSKDTITGYSITEDYHPKMAVGATALMHYTYKITAGFEMGAHIGLGVPFQSDFTLNYLLGGSILIGKKNRIGINAGVAAGFINMLSGKVNLSQVYTDKEDIDLAYNKKFRIDRFQCSITYNLNDLFGSSPSPQ
ncbi:hypothetical protein SAMN04488505_105272 [Chitinophaga rupis]|uniref:Uncharacterized protein n=1 Tax=Chitinophaga rupis TaxID=573321 RepID=A0A1H8A3R4_9BACT|nr:hypothetical protein [Chitinophaga rupis]SEM64187.1 hypothetical protein SAMN04488505_105272 [Chitinophaga rupis]